MVGKSFGKRGYPSGTGMSGPDKIRRDGRYDASGNPRAAVRHDPHGIDQPGKGFRGSGPIDDIKVGGGAVSRSAAGGRVRRVDPL